MVIYVQMPERRIRPRDAIQHAHLIVQIATGQTEDAKESVLSKKLKVE